MARKKNSTEKLRAKLKAARNEALRERFRLGGAMADLKCACHELQVTMLKLNRVVWKTNPKV
jgi:hypothetical protein